ncbi:hypothetical protein CBR_g19120 [Chara braunii]|uniref:Uncharacterized protein n=1 Tax=Chara braunii TaxID=69332 RepID=A0A388KXC9_CHABU|nr:hypothetical protein CBR_g19120 [Chara braunii]|eukprot:GBG74714.1 hypothetical protein CBR_g19120 [Chara braunii]
MLTVNCHWSRYYNNRELEHYNEISLVLAQLWLEEVATGGTLVGLLCGEIAKGGQATVAYELLTFLSQLVDDLSTDIMSFNLSDPSQVEPVTLERKLTPTVIWANCTEDFRQYLSDHDPTTWCFLDLNELAPDNSDFDEFWKAHQENGEVPSDGDPSRIAIAGLSEEEKSKTRSTSKEEEEASAPEPREAPPARALPADRGRSALNLEVPSDAAIRHYGAATSRRRHRCNILAGYNHFMKHVVWEKDQMLLELADLGSPGGTPRSDCEFRLLLDASGCNSGFFSMHLTGILVAYSRTN